MGGGNAYPGADFGDEGIRAPAQQFTEQMIPDSSSNPSSFFTHIGFPGMGGPGLPGSSYQIHSSTTFHHNNQNNNVHNYQQQHNAQQYGHDDSYGYEVDPNHLEESSYDP